jgi:hypothetical protein
VDGSGLVLVGEQEQRLDTGGGGDDRGAAPGGRQGEGGAVAQHAGGRDSLGEYGPFGVGDGAGAQAGEPAEEGWSARVGVHDLPSRVSRL